MCYSPENSNTKPMLWRGFGKLRANLQRKQRLSRRFRPKTPQNIVRDAWSGVSPVSSLKWKPWLNSRWTESTVFVLRNSPETSIIKLELLKTVVLNWKHGGITTVWALSSDFLFTGKTSCDCETHPDLMINSAAAPLAGVQCELWLTERSRHCEGPLAVVTSLTLQPRGKYRIYHFLFITQWGPWSLKQPGFLETDRDGQRWRETVRSEGHGWRNTVSAKIVLPTSEVKSSIKLRYGKQLCTQERSRGRTKEAHF